MSKSTRSSVPAKRKASPDGASTRSSRRKAHTPSQRNGDAKSTNGDEGEADEAKEKAVDEQNGQEGNVHAIDYVGEEDVKMESATGGDEVKTSSSPPSAADQSIAPLSNGTGHGNARGNMDGPSSKEEDQDERAVEEGLEHDQSSQGDVEKEVDPEAEARQRRLQFLLDKSGIYAKLIGDRMEKQRQDRLEKEQRAAARANKDEAQSAEGNDEPTESDAAATTRRSTRHTDAESSSAAVSKLEERPSKRKRSVRSSTAKAESSRSAQEDGDTRPGSSASTPGPSFRYPSTGETNGPDGTYLGRQPDLITGTKLRDYQLAGVQWMVSLYENGLNGILADEMGLGKTLQTISFLAYLMGKGSFGPFLIVCPLSVLANWVTEFAKFAPSIPVLMYHGLPQERAEMRAQKMQIPRDRKTPPAFPVIVTTYDMVIRDRKYLSKYNWKFIIVDEGHRLKNLNCKLIQELKSYKSANRLLLTGTPLHNNLAELWSLLNFILPDIFDDLDTFQEWFNFDDVSQDRSAPLNRNEIVTSLHNILKPFLLRRLKVDVEPNLPKKKEYVLYAPLTRKQNDVYRAIVAGDIRNYLINDKVGERREKCPRTETVENDSGKGRRPTRQITEKTEEEIGRDEAIRQATKNVNNKHLQNVIMQLRKISDHPFLFDWPVDDATGEYVVNDDLIDASGKMLLLRRLLDALFAKGHKVLLFSQFTTMLDVIDDWATIYQGWKTFRIDGSTSQPDRLSQMREFNEAGDSPDACKLFLLSTRAGGLGINLVAADTVIFFDQDWNPQADLQAADRAHRIGQTKPVLVFRLVSANTVESKILQKAGMKRKLEAMVISKGKFQAVDQNGKILLGRENKQKVSTDDIARQILELDSEQIQLASKDDKIISDEDLEILLDRSDEAFARDHGWSSSLLGKGSSKKGAKSKGEKTAFEVFVPAKDDTNDGLAKMFAGDDGGDDD